jgi:hypothetical protein
MYKYQAWVDTDRIQHFLDIFATFSKLSIYEEIAWHRKMPPENGRGPVLKHITMAKKTSNRGFKGPKWRERKIFTE